MLKNDAVFRHIHEFNKEWLDPVARVNIATLLQGKLNALHISLAGILLAAPNHLNVIMLMLAATLGIGIVAVTFARLARVIGE